MDKEKKVISNMFKTFYQHNDNVISEHNRKQLKLLKEEVENNGDRLQLAKGDEYFNEITGKVANLIEGIAITFNPIYVTYSIDKVEWSGKLKDNLDWRFLYSPSESGFYIDGKNVKLDEDMVKSLYKMQGYFKLDFIKDVQQKLREKSF